MLSRQACAGWRILAWRSCWSADLFARCYHAACFFSAVSTSVASLGFSINISTSTSSSRSSKSSNCSSVRSTCNSSSILGSSGSSGSSSRTK